MKIKLNNIDITAKLPKIQSEMQVFELKSANLDDRRKAIEMFREILDLGELSPVDVKDSLHFLSTKGEIQFYKPSGALWINNFEIESKYEDERRNWKAIEIPDEEDPEAAKFILHERDQKILLSQASSLFKEAGLLSSEAYFSGVELNQVAKLDEKGNETARFPGEANVKFRYKFEDIPVDGPGAKTYAFFNPGQKKHELSGLFHNWREVVGSRKIKMPGIEEALEMAISSDREILLYFEKGYDISISSVELVYYSLPPFKFQEFTFPALRVIGAATPKKNKNEGFEFSRFYNAAPPKYYAKENIYADYLVNRL